ncbi:MAG: hypothetical protein ACOH1X_01670 [Kaistella sp.]
MKKNYLLLLLLLALLNCRSEVGGNDDNTPPIDPNIPPTNNLAQYEYKGCDGFVEFDSANKSFLLFLRSRGFDLNNDTKISCEEASKITELTNLTAVSNLKGIEAMNNLKKLQGDIYTTDGSKFSLNLYNNSFLTEVNLKNSINDCLLILPKNSKLKKITIPENSGGKLEILNLENQKLLEDLELGTMFGVLNLTNCGSLKSVKLTNNSLTQINFSEQLNTNLTSLIIGRYTTPGQVHPTKNTISNIDLSKFPNLLDLNLNNIGLEQIDLNNNINLQKVDISTNKLKTLLITKNLNLKFLYADHNHIDNLILVNNIILEDLDVSVNGMPNIDLTKNQKLKRLKISGNILSNLDISKNIELQELYCGSNILTAINPIPNVNLVFLYCENNKIVNIDLSKNPRIIYIDVSGNNLTNFNLRSGNNPNVMYMKALNVGNAGIIIDKGYYPPEPEYNYNKWYKDANNRYIN